MSSVPPVYILTEQLDTADRLLRQGQIMPAKERYEYVIKAIDDAVRGNGFKAGAVGAAIGAFVGFAFPFGQLVTVPLGTWLGAKYGKQLIESIIGSENFDIYVRAVQGSKACEKALYE